MESKLQVRQVASALVERVRKPIDTVLKLKGKFKVEHFDKEGHLLGTYDIKNDVTNQGGNSILDVYFNSVTPITTWYIGLIDNASYSAVAAADVMNSHAGWIEATYYSQANRVSWGQGSSSSRTVTNASAATFTINGGGGTVEGIFITSNNTISGTTGTLWSTALFGSPIAVSSGDQLKITYSISD